MPKFAPTIAIAAGLVAFAGAAEAACTRADLAGKWTVMTPVATCTSVTISSTGGLSGQCIPNDGGFSAPLGGSLSITTACKVTGTARIGPLSYSVTGRAERATGTQKPNTMVLRGFRTGDQGPVLAFRN